MTLRPGRSKLRSAVITLAVAALTVTGTVTVIGRTTPAHAASTVEDEGADCPVPNTSVPASSRLPDPFRKLDGTRITTKAEWRCRRAETRELAERTVYGQKPAKPATVSGTVSNTSIQVNVSDQGRNASFSASVQLPSGTGPFPAVVVLGGSAPTPPPSATPAPRSSTTTPWPSAGKAPPATTSRAPSTRSMAPTAAPES